MSRPLAALVLFAAAGFAADPERPDPKKFPDKWEKDGLAVEVSTAGVKETGLGVVLKVTNNTKKVITLKGQHLDETFIKTGKPDQNSPLLGVELADAFGSRKVAVLRAAGLRVGKEGGELKPGESGNLTLGFDRPLVADHYYLTVPGDAVGLPHDVRIVVPAAKIGPEKK